MISVPDVDFYGDASTWPISTLVHCESLVERSERFDWKIRPHRHTGLTQLFFLLNGEGGSRVDSVAYTLSAPCLLIVPERSVHEFEWAGPVEGYALSLHSNLVAALSQRVERLGDVFGKPVLMDAGHDRDWLAALFVAIQSESLESNAYRDIALDSLIRSLAVWIARHGTEENGRQPPAGRDAPRYRRLLRLIDEHHTEHWPVAAYADRLGVSPTHLNAVCRRHAGRSTLDLVHARLALAARRELAYTDGSIAGIAHRLGFLDPSYFTRFFKRVTGMTPGAFRRETGTHPADHGDA